MFCSSQLLRGSELTLLLPCPALPCSLLPALPAVEMGNYGVVPNYFEQNQAEALDLDISVMDTLVK